MGARQKLNAAYFHGCLIVSGLVGLVAQSWTLFWLALVVSFGALLPLGRDQAPARPSARGQGPVSRPGPGREGTA